MWWHVDLSLNCIFVPLDFLLTDTGGCGEVGQQKSQLRVAFLVWSDVDVGFGRKQ